MAVAVPMTQPLTRIQQAAQWHAARHALYRRDFPTFAAQQLKIVTKASNLDPFTLYPYQAKMWAQFQRQLDRTGMIRQIILKGRQAGTSTLSQGVLFWRTVLNPYVNSIVVAHDVGTAQTIFGMARRFYEHLDPALQPQVRYSTKQELVFDVESEKGKTSAKGLNSKIVVATAKNIHSGAGGTFQCVHLSEAARYSNPEEIQSSTLQTVPEAAGSVVVIESTARPEGHWFREMCDAAERGQSPYEFSFVSYTDDPTCWIGLAPGEVIVPEDELEIELVERLGAKPEQLKWRRRKLASMAGDLDTFRQEYPSTPDEAWVTKDWAVFPPQQLRVLRQALRGPRRRCHIFAGPRLTSAHDGPLQVFEEPKTGVLYDIGVDVSLGIGQDYSAACVLSRPHGVQVAEFTSDRVEPGEFVDVLEALGRFYNTAQICVEVNGPGYYTNAELSRRYPNMYIWRRKDRIKHQMTNFFGFETTLKSKKWLVSLAKDRLYRYVNSDAPKAYPLVVSQDLWKEMTVFVKADDGESFAAAPGYTDDRVMAWMLAVNASADDYGIEMEATDAPETPALEVRNPGEWMTDEEHTMVKTGHYDSDAWDVRGMRR